MLLGSIRDYVRERGTVSVQEVAHHFDIAADTARFALGYWQNRGRIQALGSGCASSSSSCASEGSCGTKSCGSPETATLYRWIRGETPLRWLRHS